MQRHVSAHLELTVSGPAQLAFIVEVARGYAVTESLSITRDGRAVTVPEWDDVHGARIRSLDTDAAKVVLDYTATVTDFAETVPATDVELLTYLRPSRYCEADSLFPTARAEFAGLAAGPELLAAVSSWVGTELSYVPGSSLPTDGAVNTLLARHGVCRDYAHLVIALLRALDVPARLAAVYAPGLDPMDFHAVAEAWVEGAWHVVDATTLAPRSTLMRIATGRDAADTAFLSNYGANVRLDNLWVTAVADELPGDDVTQLARIH